jgi:hypothetical protein
VADHAVAQLKERGDPWRLKRKRLRRDRRQRDRMEGIPRTPDTPPSVLSAPVSPAGAFHLLMEGPCPSLLGATFGNFHRTYGSSIRRDRSARCAN